ncbi:MAG: SH3 domain-containing protein, partial [Burkholderiales bacterium]|nr:SH3 domain-containing protein [Anaerolineae bacterium]
MHSKRFTLVTVMCFLLLIAAAPVVLAQQQAPLQMQFALDVLSEAVGQPVSISSLRRWEFAQTEYGDTSLGCAQDGQAYTQVVTDGYQFSLSFAALLYDIRVSADGGIAFICNVVPDSGPTITPGGPTLVPFPTFTPTSPPPPPPTLVPTPVDLLTCPALAPRLQAGAQGRVIPDAGINNNVRSRPGLSGTKIGEIAAGGVFTVLSGPICASGYTWWRVNFNG